jgi:hypothetical protein
VGSPGRRVRGLFLGAGEVVFLLLLALPDARTDPVPYLLLTAVGSLLALFAARSLSASGPGFLLLCASLFRATVLLRPADLSDDLYRYLWDDAVGRAGLSPYALAPEDPALAGIDPALQDRVAHREVRTVYPPVAQAAFRAAGLAGAGPLAVKALFGAADVAVVALLASGGAAPLRFAAALYAFHPLAVTESAGQGHLDPLGLALLLAALLFLARRRRALAGVALAASVLTKYVSLVAAPALVRRGRLALAAPFALTIAVFWIAASWGAASPAGGLSDYATRWEFNGILYPAVAAVVARSDLPERAKESFLALKERLHHPRWTQALFPYFYAGFFARAALGVLLAVLLFGIAWKIRDPWDATFASLGALLLVSPTLHPWYLLWILPFAAARREPAFLYLCAVIPLSYLLLYPVPGISAGLVTAVEFGPFAVLLGRTLWKSGRGTRTGRGASPAAAA